MLSGFVPFRGENDKELHNNIIKGNFPSIDNISNECSDLLNKILEVDPNKRLDLDDILNHKWFKNFDDKKSVHLFTKAEKIIFGKLNIDYRLGYGEDLLENFSYKNLDSEFDDGNKNVKTSSNIITPNNSIINPYYNDEEEIYFSDLIIRDNILKFNLKVRELNLNYEVKYNADVDQGFIRNENKNKIMRSLNNSIDESNNKKKENNLDNNNKGKYIKEENDIEDDKSNDKKNKIKENNNFNINENALKFVEDFGYNREYIIKCLLNDELNHCTATYYLKISLMEE
jgi:serine/threonine protein kinase